MANSRRKMREVPAVQWREALTLLERMVRWGVLRCRIRDDEESAAAGTERALIIKARKFLTEVEP